MREILADLAHWEENDEEIAVATLVRVRGSAPRLPGARLCVTRSGRMAGSVTAGCVESDVFDRALQVLDGGKPVVASYGIDDEVGLQVGLSCGGSIDILIEPLPADAAWQAVRQAVQDGRPSALAIGLEPISLLGLKVGVLGDGTWVGSIDPGLDQQVADEGRRLSAQGGTRVLTLPWPGGEATVYLEGFPPLLRLFIVGAQHTAVPLCQMAKRLGFRVSVIDPRRAFASLERFPEADDLIRAWPGEVLDEESLDVSSFLVILTHDPKFDLPALAPALRSSARYIGVVGSKVTQERRKLRLREQGFGEKEIARIRGPIGLDIGARTPEETALAILAEMLAVRYGRHGGPLKERQAPINADC